LGGTCYLSILPVDQGVEHSAGASFAKNPDYFDPENIVKLAIEAGCNAVASTFGVLAIVSRKYTHKIPFSVKVNHNELVSYPNKFDQLLFGTVKQTLDMGAAAVGATIYLGSEQSSRQIVQVSQAFALAHDCGMATALWCYVRDKAFKLDQSYEASADLTGQADHLGTTIQADLIKQKLPENNGGYKALKNGSTQYGKYDDRMYTELTTGHPIDLCRYQVANCYMGRTGLINSGGGLGRMILRMRSKRRLSTNEREGRDSFSGESFSRSDERGDRVAKLHSGCLFVSRGESRMSSLFVNENERMQVVRRICRTKDQPSPIVLGAV
jgi:class I fructose-bisphosphate aldolase